MDIANNLIVFNMQTEPTELQQVLQSIQAVEVRLENKFKESEVRLEAKIDTFNEKFDNYQKATQSLVNLAFSLIASATVITVVSSVFRR
jgi:predicted PurR-regulated permease PerM